MPNRSFSGFCGVFCINYFDEGLSHWSVFSDALFDSQKPCTGSPLAFAAFRKSLDTKKKRMAEQTVELEGDSPESVIVPNPNLQPAKYKKGRANSAPSSFRRSRNVSQQLPRLQQIVATPAVLTVALPALARRRRPMRQHTVRDVQNFLAANNLTNAQLADPAVFSNTV